MSVFSSSLGIIIIHEKDFYYYLRPFDVEWSLNIYKTLEIGHLKLRKHMNGKDAILEYLKNHVSQEDRLRMEQLIFEEM